MKQYDDDRNVIAKTCINCNQFKSIDYFHKMQSVPHTFGGGLIKSYYGPNEDIHVDSCKECANASAAITNRMCGPCKESGDGNRSW